MNRLIFPLAFIVLLAVACSKAAEEPEKVPEIDLPPTVVTWEKVTHDFGEIPNNKKVSHRFIFTNTGDKPLKIYSVKPSCSCTAGEYTHGEIKPGEKGFVELVFEPGGKEGIASKSATVYMNAEPPNQLLRFMAVLKPE